jgi:hypothetical protein
MEIDSSANGFAENLTTPSLPAEFCQIFNPKNPELTAIRWGNNYDY